MNKPIVWTISGADCSGGAGIAADIKTAHAIGVEMCHLITANTVQNSQQLQSVNPVDVNILAQQADILLNDKAPAVIKVGLVVTKAQVTWISDCIAKIKQLIPSVQVVYDPVGQASVGGKFSILTYTDLAPLIDCVDVITPNLLEAKMLCASDSDNPEYLAKTLCQRGSKAVIVKGGHSNDEHKVSDVAYDSDSELFYSVENKKVATSYSHGGGCSFASALSAFLAHGYLLRDALALTNAFIQQGLSAHIGQLDYYGAFEQTHWPVDKKVFPKINAPINERYASLPPFASLNSERGSQSLGLYPVVDSLQWLETLLPLGLEIIQLRIKNKSEPELDQIIEQAVALSRDFSTRVFINDYWQLAIKHGAYGVHIGQEDLMDADLTAIQASGIRLGISTHGCYEFLLAQQLQPSYIAVGAIFPTVTKDMTGQIQGVENLTKILSLSTQIPVVAIGGINLQRAKGVWQSGVDSIAVVTAITLADDPKAAVSDFQQLFANNR